MTRFVRYGMMVLMTLLTASACVRELPEPSVDGDPFPEEGKVTITFSVPEPELKADTKAIGGQLKTLHVAVFGSSGFLKEYIKAKNLGKTGQVEYYDAYGHRRMVDNYEYSVTLTLSDKKRIIHFVGNGPETIPFDADTTVMTTLMSEGGEGGFWQMRRVNSIGAKKNDEGHYIDQYGHPIEDGTGYVPDDYTTAQMNSVPMVRNWAQISILAADKAVSNFEPISFAVVNVPSKGTIAPVMKGPGGTKQFVEQYDTRTFDYLANTLEYPASLPDDAIFDGTIPDMASFLPGSLAQGVVPYKTTTAGDGAVSLYERPIPNDPDKVTYVIVYGSYYKNGEKVGDYFYKLNLADENGNYYPIYRNFNYRININKVGAAGFDTPLEAAKSVGGVDISSEIEGSLGDISDGLARMIVQPWTAHSFIVQQRNNDVLSVKLYAYDNNTSMPLVLNTSCQDSIMKHVGGEDIMICSNIPDPVRNPVTWELLPPPGVQVINPNDVFIGRPSAGSTNIEDDGWRKIYFSTIAPEFETPQRQTLRINVCYKHGDLVQTLYRDIEITVLPEQTMLLSCSSDPLDAVPGAEQTLTISVPDNLPQSMFPLEFIIEPEDMTLMPVRGSDIPVISGKSIADANAGAVTNTFQFVRTVMWEEYESARLDPERRWQDDDGNWWRSFVSRFESTRAESATTIWVDNEYFRKADKAFENGPKSFMNLRFEPIPKENTPNVTLHFDVEESYKHGFPEIQLDATNFTITSGLPAGVHGEDQGNGTTRYVFTPVKPEQDFTCATTVDFSDPDGGNISASLTCLSPDQYYEDATVSSHRFTVLGFLDGVGVTNNSSNSNVVFGRICHDSGSGKAVFFGFYDEVSGPAALTLLNVADGKALADMSVPMTNGVVAYRNLEAGAASGYHEINFTTKKAVSTTIQSFQMTAPNYVKETVPATPRFTGSIWNYKNMTINTGNVLKKDNNYNFVSKGNKNNYFSITLNGQVKAKVTFTPSGSGQLSITDNSSGLKLIPGGSETAFSMRVESENNTDLLYYVEITFADGYVPAPGEISLADGESYWKYPGTGEHRYIWNLKKDEAFQQPHTITFNINDEVRITKIMIKSANSYQEL